MTPEKVTIFDGPRLYVIGRTLVDRGELQRFLDDHGHTESPFATVHESDADQLAATAGRICYDSFSSGRPVEEYLPHIIESGHGSVVSHPQFSVLVTRVSRSCLREFIRHQAGFVYSEQSQRYVLLPPRFVRPPHLTADTDAEWVAGVTAQYARYRAEYEASRARGLTRKVALGVARAHLPESTETRIVITGNVRAWRNVIDQRANEHADAEIRGLVTEIYHELKRHTTLFDDYVCNPYPETPHKKV